MRQNRSTSATLMTGVIGIAGGGIAGLTAALCLERQGFHVRVFEKSSGPADYGAGIQLSPNAFKVLAHLGLGGRLKAAGFAPNCVDIRNGITGKPLTRFELGEAVLARHGAPYLVLHRAEIANILREACGKSDNIEILFDQEVSDLRFHDGGVSVTIKAGDNNGEQAVAALIGADGVWSNLRRFVSGAETPRFADRIAWRAVVPTDALPDHFSLSSTGLWLGPKAHVVHYPLRDGSITNIVAITPPPEGMKTEPRKWQKTDNTDSRLAAFYHWSKPIQELIATRAAWGGWPLYRVKQMRACAAARLCLIGDAAHATEPYAAQGGACAIEDAAVLAKLCAHHDGNFEQAFKDFEHVRKPRVNKVLGLTQNNRKIYHLPHIATFARDLGMKLAPQERLQQRMDWLYGWEA